MQHLCALPVQRLCQANEERSRPTFCCLTKRELAGQNAPSSKSAKTVELYFMRGFIQGPLETVERTKKVASWPSGSAPKAESGKIFCRRELSLRQTTRGYIILAGSPVSDFVGSLL